MGDFRGGLRRNIKSTFGFFLMVPPDEQAPRQRVRSLPLFQRLTALPQRRHQAGQI